MIPSDREDPRFFPPQVALYLVKIACERPDLMECSLSQWDCTELARQLMAAKIVGSISDSTIRRILHNHKLKPWRHHLWLSSKVKRYKLGWSTIRVSCFIILLFIVPG